MAAIAFFAAGVTLGATITVGQARKGMCPLELSLANKVLGHVIGVDVEVTMAVVSKGCGI